MTAVNPLPNILTWLRLVAGIVLFALLASAVGAAPFAGHIPPDMQERLAVAAFVTFVIGAVTDWFDGWLARKLNATTDWGATSTRSPTRSWSAAPSWAWPPWATSRTSWSPAP